LNGVRSRYISYIIISMIGMHTIEDHLHKRKILLHYIHSEGSCCFSIQFLHIHRPLFFHITLLWCLYSLFFDLDPIINGILHDTLLFFPHSSFIIHMPRSLLVKGVQGPDYVPFWPNCTFFCQIVGFHPK
jgi:hypothetical protein